MINLLIISPNFNKCCGVSNHVYLLLKELKKNKSINLYFLTNGGDNLNKIIELGINYRLYHFNKGDKNIITAFKFFNFLRTFCKIEKINIIHTHHRYLEFISWAVSKFYNAKTVTTVHSIVTGFRYLSFRSSRIICVSNHVRNMIVNEFGKPDFNLTVLYNFIDEPAFEEANKYDIREKLCVDKNSKNILFIGRINKIKGVDILLKSFQKIKKNNTDLLLLMVGEIEEHELTYYDYKEDGIKIINPTNDIIDYYKISDVVILPSRVEPLGYVMLEAGMYKVPFIGSNTGGIAEFINDHEDGILVEPEDINGLSNSIIEIMENSELKTYLTKNLYEKVKRECNKENYIQKLINIYNELLINDK